VIDQQTWVTLLPLFTLLLASIQGYGVVPIVNYIKAKLGRLARRKLPGELTLILTFGVCLVLASLTLIVEGFLTPDRLSNTEIIATFITVFTVAKVRYDMLKRKKVKKEPPAEYYTRGELLNRNISGHDWPDFYQN
jgi:hypothetical protein